MAPGPTLVLAVLLLLLSVLVLMLTVLLLIVLMVGRVLSTGLGLVHALHVIDGRTPQHLKPNRRGSQQ